MVGILQLQRGRNCLVDRGKRDHNHGLWIVKRRRGIQPKIERIVFRKSDGWNVLKLGRVQAGHQTNQIQHRAHIRAIRRCTGVRDHRCTLHGTDQVRRVAIRDHLCKCLPMTVVQQQGSAALSQAGYLLIRGPLEAFFVRLQVQRRSQLA